MRSIDHLHSLARQDPRRVVLPEAWDPRVIEAAGIVARLGLARPILLGSPDELRRTAKDAGLDLPDVTIVEQADDERLESYVQRLVELRAKKGLTPEKARELLRSPMYYSGMMVDRGDADAAVAGCATSTADVVRAYIHVIRPAEGVATVSGASIIALPDGSIAEHDTLFFADTGVVPEPTPEQLAQIAMSTAKTYRAFFDTEPRVAMISFSTKSSATHPLAEKVKRATEIARRLAPDLLIDGELQADAALVPGVARRKLKDSPVAGRANVLIFPSLDVGNVAYKLMERLGRARSLGPVLQGLRKPASDLSRGCTARDIADVCAVVSIEAARWE